MLNRELREPAPTARLIEDVERAKQAGYLTWLEAAREIDALRSGLTIAPIWEDYGLRTNPLTGRMQ